MSILGERLASAMVQKGVRQSDVCKTLNIPKSAMSQYLSGKSTKMPTDRLHSLALYFGKTEAWLLGYDDERNVTAEEDRVLFLYDRLNEHDKAVVMELMERLGGK